MESERSAPLIGWNYFLNPKLLCSIKSVGSMFHHQRREDESTVEPVLYILDILNSISNSSLTILLWLSAALEFRFVLWDMPVEVSRRIGEHNASKYIIRLYLLLASLLFLSRSGRSVCLLSA
jgi:hypothetical protein